MTLTPSTIHSAPGAKKTTKRVGRGNGSGKGTTAARGQKGQRARSGGTRGIARRAMKAMIQKVPKLRGFRSMYGKPEVVTLSQLNRLFTDGDVVTPANLKQKGIVDHPENGVKVLATGELTKKITLKGCFASKKVAETVEKLGGKVVF